MTTESSSGSFVFVDSTPDNEPKIVEKTTSVDSFVDLKGKLRVIGNEFEEIKEMKFFFELCFVYKKFFFFFSVHSTKKDDNDDDDDDNNTNMEDLEEEIHKDFENLTTTEKELLEEESEEDSQVR